MNCRQWRGRHDAAVVSRIIILLSPTRLQVSNTIPEIQTPSSNQAPFIPPPPFPPRAGSTGSTDSACESDSDESLTSAEGASVLKKRRRGGGGGGGLDCSHRG